MGLRDFDINGFIEDMKACKPPYKCPFPDCGKVYKSYSGIHQHLLSHAPGGSNAGSGARTPNIPSGRRSPVEAQPFYKSPQKDSLFYNEAEKMIEFESSEGSLQRLSIYDALEVVSKEDWEASLPADAFEQEEKKPEELPSTPVNKVIKRGKKIGMKMKTPKSSMKIKNVEAEESKKADGAENEKKPLKLPEASYHEIEDYDITDAPKRTGAYYRFVEKSAEELDEMVEYDMDEEDVAWLNLINEKRSQDGQARILEDQFELLMDRLEKESYFHVQSNGKDYSAPIDDDAICCICMDGECSNTNVILFCDLCNLAVHQECYGVPYIPEGQWLCRRCLQSPSRSVECCLCPNRGGAFKQTDDGRWAHVVCGLWIPEVGFANTVFLEPIDSIDNIPPARWKLSCRVCKQRGVGACIQCHKPNCYTAFHVTCGLLAGLHMKMDTIREPTGTGLSVTVRKTAYCDVHTPQDSDCTPKLDDIAALGISTMKGKSKSPKKGELGNPVPVLFRGLMNFSPQCPWDKVQKIASLINVPRKNQFFQRLMAYWTLKRQTRNGVPLIRRLQFAKANKENKGPETPQKNAHHSQKKKEREREKENAMENAALKKVKGDLEDMIEERRSMRRLRQDLEKVRLLCELIRKREQRKRDLIVAENNIIEVKLTPFLYFLKKLLEQLQEIDTSEIFAEPVSLDDVPDYLDHIKKPMDFSTMFGKLESFKYSNIDLLESDFNLMVENCLSYNERDTIFFRFGVTMRDKGGAIIRQAKREIESIGFDPDSGLHTTERLTPREELSDDKIMKEIDSFVNDDNEHLPLEVQLRRLLELQDRVMVLHHPVAKVKRQKMLKIEITKVRRELSLDKSSQKAIEQEDQQEKASKNSKKKAKEKEPSPEPEAEEESEQEPTPAPRRLRASGKAESNQADSAAENSQNSKKIVKRGRKRKASDDEEEEPPAKKENLEKTPLKSLSQSSPTKSPAGVNRRTAVLFTRKKQQAQPVDESETSGNKTDSKKKVAIQTLDEDIMENQETEVQGAATNSAAAGSNSVGSLEKPAAKKRGRKSKAEKEQLEREKKEELVKVAEVKFPASSWRGPDAGPSSCAPSESFKNYRGIGGDNSTDEDTATDSATDATNDSDDSDGSDANADDSDMDESGSGITSASGMTINLEPLDIVWAKCRGYPWYPALIINPKMPRTGYLHNGVPIPVPPQEVLEMALRHETPHYLILFFDSRRTWQWLPRDKLEPLGINIEVDKVKMVSSKKPTDRKAVKKAYEDAIMHRCRVTGENVTLSGGDSSGTEGDSAKEK